MKQVIIPPQWTAPHDQGEVTGGWLASFNDEALNALVAEALVYNADVRIAAANVERAGAYVDYVSAGLYPLVTATHFKKTVDGSIYRGYTVPASWELDVWGRVRYAKRAANSQLAATQADYNYARQSLTAMVAKSWFLIAEITQQIELARQSVNLYERYLTLARDQYRIGKGTQTDVELAEAGLSSAKSSLRNFQLKYDQSLLALETLIGRYPSASLRVSATLPTLSGPAPTGVPSSLLERRPDVIAAERQVAAAFDLIGEAKAARLPTISLTATLSYIKGNGGSDLNLGHSIFATLFDAGALQAQVEISTAEEKRALAEYAKVGLRAFTEVEDALANEVALREREIVQQESAAHNQRALELLTIQYRVGVTHLQPVLQQELAYHAAQSVLLRVQSDQLIQRVNLYLALGGDFSAEPTSQQDSVNKP